MSHLEKHVQTVLACRFCPMCRHVCTVANAIQVEAASPRGWGLLMYSLGVGILEKTETSAGERLFQCAGCELCYGDCVSDYRPAEAIRAARADLVEADTIPPSVRRVAKHLDECGNPFGEKRAERGHWSEGLGPDKDGEVLFFAGCEIGYRRPEIASAVVQVAREAKISMAVLEDEPCCGAPLHILGFWDALHDTARRNITRIAQGGYRQVVFACPTCQRAFAQVYQEELGVDWPVGVEILHVSQWLERLIQDGRVSLGPSSRARQVTYHDPCTLGRAGLGIYESPRRVLAAAEVAVTEMEFNREMARCCGSGVLHQTFPEIGAQAAADTLCDVHRTGAQTLVTSCPACKTAFLGAAKDSGLRVIDLVELVAEALA